MFALLKEKLGFKKKESIQPAVDETCYIPTFGKFSDLTDEQLINKYKYGLPDEFTVKNIFFEFIERFQSRNDEFRQELEKIKIELDSLGKRDASKKHKKIIDAKDENK